MCCAAACDLFSLSGEIAVFGNVEVALCVFSAFCVTHVGQQANRKSQKKTIIHASKGINPV